MYCKKCGTINDKDSMFCKHCGFPISEQDLTYKELQELKAGQETEEENKKDKSKKEKNQSKNKNRTKHKTKTKTKNKTKKEKPRKNNNQKTEKGMTFGQKVLMFILFIMVISLTGILAFGGYHYYKSRNIEVPNLTNMTYEEAELILAKKDLKIKKVEQITERATEDNIVLSQNKPKGTKVRKNTVIKVKVGKYQKIYILEDLTGMNVDEAISILESNNIKYEIKYKETDDYKNYTIISQKPNSGKKITEKDKVVLIVSKNTNQNIEQDESVTKDNTQNQSKNQETEEQDKTSTIE